MSITLFKDTTYTVGGLLENIERGETALPDIQRPFVWLPSRVRQLFDSMYQGFPVGYLLFWRTGAEAGARQIGTGQKTAAPQMLIVDGQQRLTALFAVMKGIPVVRKDFTEGRIRIAFCPSTRTFEVTDAAIEKDPEFIPDIADVWRAYGATRKSFLSRLEAHRGEKLSEEEDERLEAAIDRLRDLSHYPFKAVELDATVNEEQVAEVFVRINSAGVTLNQADFILTLMSVFWEEGRRQLEKFSRLATVPVKGEASPYNHFIEPRPDQLLRVGVGLAFERGRLQIVYSLLRGKDLETGVVSPERRTEQFEKLRDAQDKVVDLTNWHQFLQCLSRAGFRSARMISSENAILYTYVIWLIGKHKFKVETAPLRDVIARWFFMAHSTGRYTSSPESQLESDLQRLRDIPPGEANEFCRRLDREIGTVFTNDYWAISLPNRLQRSGGKSPPMAAYWAALNLLDAELLFSTAKVSARLDPGVKATRDIERHHLFPKKHLTTLGITTVSRQNQIANMAFVDWTENGDISADPPVEYWPVMSKRVDADRLARQRYWHALPVGWEQLDYEEFLEKRRRLIAEVVRDAFGRLAATLDPVTVRPSNIAELIRSGESANVEFKAAARWNQKANLKDPKIEHAILRTIAAFMNAEGGTLLVGVADDGRVVGLESDFKTLTKPNRDGFELFLRDLAETGLSGAAHTLVRVSFEAIDGGDVCRVDVASSAWPVYSKPWDGKDHSEFWVRTGNSTRALIGAEADQYKQEHWD